VAVWSPHTVDARRIPYTSAITSGRAKRASEGTG
jgi:hypothetical protein